ncbi:MAG TPA: hypothetical protein VGH33_11490 [Isosphaeraceae bacterium]|jgi:hypothetical protein
MRRLFQIAVMLGVASAVPMSPLLLAQVQKADAPAQQKEVGERKANFGEEKVVEKAAITVKVRALPKDAMIKVANPAVAKDAAVKEVIVRQAVPVQGNMEPQVRQFTQQFRPAMRAEYYFIRTVCAPTAEQRRLIARDGEKALREASKAYAEVQGRPVQFRNGRATYPDPRRLLEDGMAKAVKPILTPDQAAKYQAESEKRTADRRQAVITTLVAKLDQDLILSPEQREKIAAAMAEHWDDSWCQSLETLLYGDQFFPRLPDNVVVPSLDPKQRDIWHGQRSNQSFFFGFVGNMLPEEDPQEDKELIAARVEAERENPPPNAVKAAIRRVIGAPAGAMPAAKVAAPAPAVKVAPAQKK